ncbi:helix-turn-helix domain-containing protein [Paraburkholderia sp. GAS334]|uniref:helix-turn-helix domain-containing protein n=1 Tax=Paraburkholderia sp. GAS334 TaxID=3035131 RepID=UPI003D256A97
MGFALGAKQEMSDLRAGSKALGPEHVSATASSFGQRLRFDVSAGGIHLQQYECVPGTWSHDALAFCRIALQETGSPRIERVIDDSKERQIRRAGTISISPSNTYQRWTWDCEMRVILLFISQAVLDEVAFESGMGTKSFEHLTPLVVDDNLIKHTALGLLTECVVSSKASSLLIGTAGRHVAAHILTRYAQIEREDKFKGLAEWRLKRSLDFIEQNMGRDIGLEELARNSDMTPHYFCRAFRKSVGMPPYRYLVSRRIERSKELLTSTSMDVIEIALELGFSSHAHFSNTFRSLVGCAPTIYRSRSRTLSSVVQT